MRPANDDMETMHQVADAPTPGAPLQPPIPPPVEDDEWDELAPLLPEVDRVVDE